ncbi:RICIN domain-containing protein [Streptomyces sp. NPDC051907]|uniref:RICIN domain-containing protein n=1 Tax=Streptomyces sp. NPDC051907 TaxID=3155284 RepID=UPI00342DBB02
MSRTIRAALAVGAGVAALIGGVTPAHAQGSTPVAAVPAGETIVQLKVVHSGKCLDIDRARTENGVRARQWDCNGTAAQQWRVIPTDNSSFELRVVASGKCLEVENSGTQWGAAVQQWTCTGGKQMRWRAVLVDQPRKLFQLRPTHTDGRCLDVDRAMKENGALAQQWECNQTEAQLWQFEPVR